MKHINKPLGVNLNVLEQEERNKRANTEGIIILILILLGCSGLYLYSSITSPKEPRIHFSNMTSNTVVSDGETTQPKSSMSEVSITNKEQLSFKGNQEVGEQVWIYFENFDRKAKYRVDFGDGITQPMTDKSISHVYGKTGKYKVKLVISYQDKPLEKITKFIVIDEAIAVTTDAYRER